MIRFVCECGKQLQVRDEHAGQTVACPACQRRLTAPEETAPREAVQATRPLLRDEEGFDPDQEIGDRPSHQQPARTSGKAIASLSLGILSLFCNVLTGVPALILALMAFGDINRSRGRVTGQGLAIAGIATACVCTLLSCGILVPISMSVGLLLPAVQKVREAAGKAQSQNNLKVMAMGLMNYQDLNLGQLPAAAICDKNGKPLLSWRVVILPFIEQQNLYSQFKLDEPWDGPNNRRLLAQMPLIYRLPGDDATPPDHTHYQVFVGNGAAFDRTRSHRVPQDFTDGISRTILIVEAEKAVPWTKPDDVDFNPNKPILPLMSRRLHGAFNVALADGSVRLITPGLTETTFKAAITRNANDVLGPDW
jgi:hypothetical protein